MARACSTHPTLSICSMPCTSPDPGARCAAAPPRAGRHQCIYEIVKEHPQIRFSNLFSTPGAGAQAAITSKLTRPCLAQEKRDNKRLPARSSILHPPSSILDPLPSILYPPSSTLPSIIPRPCNFVTIFVSILLPFLELKNRGCIFYFFAN